MSRLRYAVAAVAVVTLAAAVGGQDKQAFTPKFKNDAGAFTTYYQKSSTTVLQTITVQQQALTQKQVSTFYYKWEPLRQEGDKWIVKQTVEGLRMEIDISGNSIVYDTTQKDASGSAANPGLINFFKNLEGSTFTVTLNKDFKVESVAQADRDAFLSKLAANNAQMDALLKKIMTEDALKQMCDPTMGMIPDAPQAVGGTWARKTPLNLGPIGMYEVTYNFTYKGKQGDTDRVDVSAGLVYTPPKDGGEGLLFRITEGTLKTADPGPGKSNGFMTYNPKTGRIEHVEINLEMTGDLKVLIGQTSTPVSLRQVQTTVIDTRDTSYVSPAAPAPEKK